MESAAFTPLHHRVDEIAALTPDFPAGVDSDGQVTTYAELSVTSIRVASALLALLETERPAVKSERPVAVLVPRNCKFLQTFVGISRLGLPILALSADLHNSQAEEDRNIDALLRLKPQLLLYDVQYLNLISSVLEKARVENVRTFSLEALLQRAEATLSLSLPHVGPDDLLAYCFTGGSTRAARAVKITHAMAAYELEMYPRIIPISLRGTQMRFLQNSSAYWGAALLGQIDVAIATRGAVVFCDAALPAEVVAAVRRFGVTAMGAVPSVLEHITPQELPSIRCVLSWGEALPYRVAQRWLPAKCTPPETPSEDCVLLDLLIATEYWLCFYKHMNDMNDGSGGGSRSLLRLLPGVEALVLAPQHSSIAEEPTRDQVGELALAGPMVSPGYADLAENVGRFEELPDSRGRQRVFFRTRDLVRWADSSRTRLEYCGRCDEMAKAGGRWVDVQEIQARIEALPEVKEVRLWFGATQRHAFIALADSWEGRTPLLAIRSLLPLDTFIHFVAGSSLPRAEHSGKVDLSRLLAEFTAPAPETQQVQKRQLEVLSRVSAARRSVLDALAGPRGRRGVDLRRLVCLCFLWYWLLVNPDELGRALVGIFKRNFPDQGPRGVVFAIASTAPLDLLRWPALFGVRRAKADGHGADWVIVSWLAMIRGLPSPAARERKRDWQGQRVVTKESWIREARSEVQALAGVMLQQPCASCLYLVTASPSQTHCCHDCLSSQGLAHSRSCLRQPCVGPRRCDGCAFIVTARPRFCCYRCEEANGTHGPLCKQKPFTSVADVPWGNALQVDASQSIDCSDVGVASDEDQNMPPRSTTFASTSVHKALVLNEKAVASVLARAVGFDAADAASPEELEAILFSIDSHTGMRLLNIARAQLKVNLSLQSVLACRALKELVSLCESAQGSGQHRSVTAPARQDEGEGFRLWTFGYNTCLSWTLRCERNLEPSAFLRAVKRLVKCQPALRLCAPSLESQQWHMEAAAHVGLLREASHRAGVTSAHVDAAAGAVLRSWPRWSTRRRLPDAVMVKECAEDGVKRLTRELRANFSPPFQVALLLHPQSGLGSAAAHLLILMSHAVGDAAAVVPLIDDLAELLAEEEGTAEGRAFEKARPHFADVMEARLVNTLKGRGAGTHEKMFLDRRMDFFSRHILKSQSWGYRQSFELDTAQLADTVARLTQSGSVEVGILALLLVVIARLRVRGGAMLQTVRTTLVHHGRDGGRDAPFGVENIVGFLTDFRTFTVPTSEHSSLFGVLSHVFAAVRERRWETPALAESLELLVNFVPLSFAPIGPFRMLGGHRRHGPDLWQQPGPPVWVKRPAEFQIEQIDVSCWSLSMAFEEAVYPRETAGRGFAEDFREVLRQLSDKPLTPVLPPLHGSRSGVSTASSCP